jgi:hypothetical protein
MLFVLQSSAGETWGMSGPGFLLFYGVLIGAAAIAVVVTRLNIDASDSYLRVGTETGTGYSGGALWRT